MKNHTNSCSGAAAIAQKAPPSKPFERFDGCVLKPDEWTDGDSFRVQLPDGRVLRRADEY